LNQDAHQQTLNKWTFKKYDGLSRVVMSGEIINNSNQTSLQTLFDAQSTISETFDSTLIQQLYYTDVSFPFAVDSSQAMEVNFYDNYAVWRDALHGSFSSNPYGNANGLLTGVKKRYTETGAWLTQAMYYDKRNRMIYTRKDYFNADIPLPESRAYLFGGELLRSEKFFSTSNIYRGYSYDFAGRTEQLTINLGNSGRADFGYVYNEIEQLITKKVQPNRQYKLAAMQKDTINRPPALSEINTQDIARKAVIISPGFSAVAYDSTLGITDTYLAEIDTTHADTLADALQTINYGYHIRGQQNCINCRNKQAYIDKENDLFAMKLDFEEDKRYFDGNISRQTWKNARIGNQQYKHFYDGVSRLTKSAYSGGVSGSNYSLDTIRYDQNGNILQLKRHVIDNLSYTYNGNQLLKVADNGTNDGFKDGANTDDDYSYWTNGALKYDRNKGIDSIVYHSYLKKVSRVKFTNGNWINFFYDGAGTLLKRKLSNTDEWVYQDEIIYKNNKYYQINHEEGRAVYDTLEQKWVHEFSYRDHQGNLRLSFRDSLATPVNGVYAPPVITQIDERDPWGLEIKPLSYQNSVNSNNYKFLSREEQPEMGWVDLMQRMYDPPTGRFLSVDPKPDVEGQESLTTYQYGYNNPIRYSDPNGDCPGCWEWMKKQWNNASTHFNKPASQAEKEMWSQRTGIPQSSIKTNSDVYAAILLEGVQNSNFHAPVRGVMNSRAKLHETAVTTSEVNLQVRANDIQNSQPSSKARNLSTTAVAEITNTDGTTQIVVSSSRQRLTPAQRNALQVGEMEVKGKGHAEATIVNHAENTGATVNKIAASRPICQGCQDAISTTNALILSPVKPVKIPFKVEQ
jgi:RHS repeat-associated protein